MILALILMPERNFICPSESVRIEYSSLFEGREGKTQLTQGITFRWKQDGYLQEQRTGKQHWIKML